MFPMAAVWLYGFGVFRQKARTGRTPWEFKSFWTMPNDMPFLPESQLTPYFPLYSDEVPKLPRPNSTLPSFVVYLDPHFLRREQHVGERCGERGGFRRQQVHPAEVFEQPLQDGRRTAARETMRPEGFLAGRLPFDKTPELTLFAAERAAGDEVLAPAVRAPSSVRSPATSSSYSCIEIYSRPKRKQIGKNLFFQNRIRLKENSGNRK